ncbi:MAG TPA: fatty acyl-AMP ligase [Vicinamibacterales bacterium]|nr:fatty acyl-AMP ligase [Vicinamibacterales bacterium]
MGRLRTLPDALTEAARADAGYTFVSARGEVFRSFADIRAASMKVSGALRDAGLRRGDLVALVLGDAEAFLTTLFGASMAGVIPASLYPPAPLGTARDLPRSLELTAGSLRASGARAVVTTAALVPAFEGIRERCPALSLVLAQERLDAALVEPDTLPGFDDIAFVQFTSGSTSAPKGVALSHANLSANIDAINGPAGLMTTGEDVGVSWLPLNHDMGLVGMALGAVYAARPCVLLPPQSFVKRPVEWLRALTRHGGTISFAPNFAYDLCVRRVKEGDLKGLDLSRWRVAGCGAEPVHPPTLAAFARKFAPAGFRETSFLPSYGLAEHVLAATFAPRGRPLRTEHVSAHELAGRRVAVPEDREAMSLALASCGSPLPGHTIEIVDEDGRPLPERHVGEILLAGPSVMRGYYQQEALTAETIRRGWLHTGDLGYVSGGELFVCGRVKDIIIASGRKYHPQDLEWAVDDLAGVRRGRVVAFGAAGQGRADRVIMVVEPSGAVSAETLTETVRRRIGDVFGLYVDEVAIVPSGTVGRTTSGKVQRAATKEKWASLADRV